MTRILVCAATALALAASAPAQAQAPPPSANYLQDRVEELERRLLQATGENERLQYELGQSQAEVARLQAMVNDLVAVRDGTAAPPPPPGPPPPRAGRDAPPPPPPDAQGSLGQLSASDLPGDAGEAYRRARDLLLNGHVREAELAFGDFVRRFGDDPNAAEARYWFAFTLLARGAHAEAAEAFVDYLRRYPRGQRAPDALVRLGVALKGLGRNQQACRAFADVPRRYPRAPQPAREAAVREARAMNCPRG